MVKEPKKLVQVAFRTRPKSLLTKAISWWTSSWKERLNGKWLDTANHVEIKLGKYTYTTTGSKGMWYKYKNATHDTDWRVRDIYVDVAEYYAMVKKAEELIGCEYDWLNIFLSDVFRLNKDNNDRVTCDEGTAIVLKECNEFKNIHKIPNLNPDILEDYVRIVEYKQHHELFGM